MDSMAQQVNNNSGHLDALSQLVLVHISCLNRMPHLCSEPITFNISNNNNSSTHLTLDVEERSRMVESNTRAIQRLNERVDDIATRMDPLVADAKEILGRERESCGILAQFEVWKIV